MNFNKSFFMFLALSAVIHGTVIAGSASLVTEEFEVNGLKVILRPASNEVVSARFVFRGGTSNYTKELEGIENFALFLAADGGTKNFSREEFHSRLERTGSTIRGGSTYDYGDISLQCLTKYWDDAWKLFADAIVNPAFNEREFNLTKEKLISAAKQAETDPDNFLRNQAMEYAFEGKDYSKVPEGTPASLPKITIEQLKNHYSGILTTSRCFLVVAGNINRQDLTAKINEAFAALPKGSYTPTPPDQLKFSNAEIKTHSREMATNYVRGVMSAPAIGSADEVPMKLAMNILYDRLFVEVRSKRNLSYAPAAVFPSLRTPYTFLYVSTTDPNQAVQVMMDEVNKIRKEGFKEQELKNKKNTFLTHHYMGLETNESQTRQLALAEVHGNWKRTEELVKKVDNVSVKDLNRVMNEHLSGIRWFYLGNPEVIDKKIFNQSFTPIDWKPGQSRPY